MLPKAMSPGRRFSRQYTSPLIKESKYDRLVAYDVKLALRYLFRLRGRPAYRFDGMAAHVIPALLPPAIADDIP